MQDFQWFSARQWTLCSHRQLLGQQQVLLLTALFLIPGGVQAIAMSVLRGVNDTRTPAIVAITSFWILGVAVGALAGFFLGFGPTGVWGGLLL